MKAYALVQGPKRKVLLVCNYCDMLWVMGAEMFKPSTPDQLARNDRAICKENDAYIVRVDYALGESITTPRKRKA